MNPWVTIIAQYGIEFAIDLAQIIKDKTDPTTDDFLALKSKYASKSAEQYLGDAQTAVKAP